MLRPIIVEGFLVGPGRFELGASCAPTPKNLNQLLKTILKIKDLKWCDLGASWKPPFGLRMLFEPLEKPAEPAISFHRAVVLLIIRK